MFQILNRLSAHILSKPSSGRLLTRLPSALSLHHEALFLRGCFIMLRRLSLSDNCAERSLWYFFFIRLSE